MVNSKIDKGSVDGVLLAHQFTNRMVVLAHYTIMEAHISSI